MLFMMITGFVPLVVVLIPLLTVLSRNMRSLEEEKVYDTATQLGKHITEVMDRSAKDLETLVTNPLLADPNGDPTEKLTEMRRLVAVYKSYSDLSLYDEKGFMMASTTEDHPSFREYTSWFRDALAGRMTISQPHKRLDHPGLFLTVYLPVKSVSGEIRQVIKARLSFNRVIGLLEGINVGKAGSVILLDSLGNVLCSPSQDRLMEKFDGRVSPAHWLTHFVDVYTDPSGESFLYGAATLPRSQTHVDSHWVLLAMKPMREVKAVMWQAQMAMAIATISMIAVATLLGLFLSRKISLPLESIGRVARLVASGDLGTKARGGGSIEIDQLATSFNRMIEELGEHRSGLENLVLSRTESLSRSQADLERTTARLQAAIDSTNNGFLVEDLEGNIVVVNELFINLLGVERHELSENTADALLAVLREKWEISGKGFATWAEARRLGETIDAEAVELNGSRGTLHVFSAPILDHREDKVGRVWTIRDLTEQRELESSLRQSQKMEAVGQLAGGVAHDFNNLLTGILGNLALVELEMENRGQLNCHENLKIAVKAGERAAELVKQLLGFSRRSRMNLKACDANEVLVEVRDILTATIDPRVRIELKLEAQPWGVIADVSMLSQVIMNMAVNAKDAMPNGGHLYFRSSNETASPTDFIAGGDGKPGDYIRLTIEDDGEGIPLDVQKKVFEPFFTTKAPGKGTGLGLATSFGIVKQLGGWIEMDSRPGEGTRFDIYLPRSAAAEAQPEVLSSGLQAVPGGIAEPACTETILIVDDEDVVRLVASTLLKKLGYRVIEATDGLKALEIFATRASEIDLVLLDLTMPNLSGKETLKLIRERHGEVPVLVCSGYLVDLNEFAEECGTCPDGFVQKPYSFGDMARAIRDALSFQQRAA